MTLRPITVRESDGVSPPGAEWLRSLRQRIADRRGDRHASVAPLDGRDVPLLSVVILNWNGAAVIERCIQHVLAQTHPRLEVIVVDNGSTDASLDILRVHAARGEVRLIESATNRGVGGGRNLGIAAARGDAVAFLDNDAFADPIWAAEIVRAFEADSRIGALASLVFFDRQKAILNSAGGTLNWRGHGADWCFNAPYETASLPDTVLYPTGCGMALRREVLAAIGPHDEAIPYYGCDDVEVGIRAWTLGHRVALARSAWIDHESGHSRSQRPDQVFLRECGRIRNALKYFPAHRLPIWLVHEAQLLDHLRSRATRALPLRAWTWNLRHLASAMRARWRSGAMPGLQPLLYPSWRGFPWLQPDNRAFRPDPRLAAARVVLDGQRDGGALHFGWYEARREDGREFRWSAERASLLIRIESANHLAVLWRAARPGQRVELTLRKPGEIDPLWRGEAAPGSSWETARLSCTVPSGKYELLFRSQPTHMTGDRHETGVAVARIEAC